MKTQKQIQGFHEMKSIDDLINAGYHYHHTATRKGYQSRKYDSIIPYSGRFGTGYVVKSNNIRSNRYGIMMAYYVK